MSKFERFVIWWIDNIYFGPFDLMHWCMSKADNLLGLYAVLVTTILMIPVFLVLMLGSMLLTGIGFISAVLLAPIVIPIQLGFKLYRYCRDKS